MEYLNNTINLTKLIQNPIFNNQRKPIFQAHKKHLQNLLMHLTIKQISSIFKELKYRIFFDHSVIKPGIYNYKTHICLENNK